MNKCYNNISNKQRKKSSSSSSGTASDNEDDTTYPPHPIEGSLDDASSDRSMVSLLQERLLVHNETTSTAVQVLIPGVTSTILKCKDSIVEGKSVVDSSASVGSANVQHIAESGVIGRVLTAVSSNAQCSCCTYICHESSHSSFLIIQYRC